MSDLIQIDGSYGEGGGQILRTSVSLAAITGKPVEIHNVRGKRTKPGLQPQHLAAVRAGGALCGAKLTGDEAGSRFLRVEPQHPVAPGDYHFTIGTAGAAPLVVQTVLVPLALVSGPSRVTVTGGTHVPHSPAADYVEHIYLPALEKAGIRAKFSYSAAGFFPKGGGQIDVSIEGGSSIKPLDLSERGALQELRAFIVSSNLPEHVAQRGADTVEKAMKAIGRKVVIEPRPKPSPGPGAAVVMVAKCETGMAGFSSIGELRKPMEKVAEKPGQEFLRWWKSGAACDEHLADQLVLPMCFASGPSTWTTPEVTEHLRTVIWVVQHFLDVEAAVEEREDGSGLVRLRPLG